jgi:hypothetical protein
MNKHKKNKSKGQSLGKGTQFYKAIKWHKFGGSNHTVKSAMLSNTWLTYTKKSLKDTGKAKESYEGHVNAEFNELYNFGKDLSISWDANPDGRRLHGRG